MVVDVGLTLTCVKGSSNRCQTPIPTCIHCNYSEFKEVTWAMVGCSEEQLWLIHTAVGGEWSAPPADVVDLNTVPEVRVHSSDVQREGRAPRKEDG